MPGNIRDTDKGWADIAQAAARAGSLSVKVGWLEDAGQHRPRPVTTAAGRLARIDRHLAAGGGGSVAGAVASGGGESLSLAALMAVHEFGVPTKGIPERSVLRATFDLRRDQLEALIARLSAQILDRKTTAERALGIIGAWMAGQLKGAFGHLDHTPLKPATIRRKGSDVPLIDTAQLRNSVNWVVVKAGT